MNRIRTVLTKLSAYREPLLSRLAQSWAAVQTFLTRVWANAQPVVSRVWDTIKSFLAQVWEKAQPLLQRAWERIRPALARGWNVIEPHVTRAWTKIEPHATKLWAQTAPARELANQKLAGVKQRWNGVSAQTRRGLTGVASVAGIAVIGLGLIGTASGTPSDEGPAPAAAMSEQRTQDEGNRNDSREEPSQSPETEAEEEAEEEAEDSNDDSADEKEAKDEEPEAVGGLDETQMDNAIAIVEAGQDEGISERGQKVAIATAMQESKMKNLASDKLPESFDYTSEGSGNDHDSVGLFQQRPSSGWGSIEDCMDPEKSAKSFYSSLEDVDGWEDMSITKAAQKVQVSAYPDAYAQWEDMAEDVVDEVNDKS